jgi:aminoglycoside 6'-N-acetyltransferase I
MRLLTRLAEERFQRGSQTAWRDQASALEEVHESFSAGRISRVALDENGDVLGWIGGAPQYNGHVWELRPLVVREGCRGRGIGRALVADLEAQVKARGGLTLWLGTDDEDEMTTLAGVDLYPNTWDHIAAIRNLKGHPYEFYQKQGFVIIGVLPDANGLGNPDIFMAKRIGG